MGLKKKAVKGASLRTVRKDKEVQPTPGTVGVDAELMRRVTDGLGFDADDIVNAAVAQPNLFRDAITYMGDCLRIYNRAKMEYDNIRAQRASALRTDAIESGTRTTEGALGEALVQDAKVIAAMRIKNEAEELYEQARLLIDAYRMRRDSIKVCADLVRLRLGADGGVGGSSEEDLVRRAIRDKYA